METITSDDILGKEVVDSEGDMLGIVMKLHIEKASKKIVGITVDQGFRKPDLYVGIRNIKNFGVDSVFINRVPVDKYEGSEILDYGGNVVGKVKEIVSKRNRIVSLIATAKGFSNETAEINPRFVKELGTKVILKPNAQLKWKKNEISWKRLIKKSE